MAVTGTTTFDLILRGGHVVDLAAGCDGLFDVGIRAGKIASDRKGLKGARRVIDVADEVVLPRFVLKDGVKYDPDSPLLLVPVEATRAAA